MQRPQNLNSPKFGPATCSTVPYLRLICLPSRSGLARLYWIIGSDKTSPQTKPHHRSKLKSAYIQPSPTLQTSFLINTELSSQSNFCRSTSNQFSRSLRHQNNIATMFRRALLNAPRVAGRALLASAPATRPALTQVTSTIAVAGRRQYHEKVLDHYSRPRNVGSMSKTDTDVGTGLVGAPACGDVMKLQIRVDPTNNTISDVKFKTFGCGSAIASSSYLTELVRGMTLEEAGRVRNTEIAKELCLPPVKRKSSPNTPCTEI